MGHVKPGIVTAAALFFGHIFPFLWRLPTETRRLQLKLNRCMEDIAVPLLENTRREMQGLGEKGKEEKSIIGLLSASSAFTRIQHEAHEADSSDLPQLRLRMPIRACRCLRRRSWPR